MSASLGVSVCVRACVCQREQRRLWLILQQKPLRGEMEPTKQRQDRGEGTWCYSDWLCPPHMHTHKHRLRHIHTCTTSAFSSPSLHKCWPEQGRIGGMEGICCLHTFTPPLQQWITPCAADWSDRSKETAYMSVKKKNQYSLQRWKPVNLSDIKETDRRKRRSFELNHWTNAYLIHSVI